MTATLRTALAVLVLALAATSALASPDAMTLEPAVVNTELGRTFTVRSTIRNDDRSQPAALVAHLTVFSLKDGTYVDPEDWSSERTRYLAPIPPGGATTIAWSLKAVNDGTFAVSVLAVPAGALTRNPVTAPPARVDVAERKTLNEGGILFLSIGLPAALALVAVGLRLRRRRPRPHQDGMSPLPPG